MKTIIRNIAAGLLLAIAIPASAQELAPTYFMETSTFNHQLNPALLKEGSVSVLLGNFNIAAGTNFGASNFVYKNTGANSAQYPLTTFMNPNISTEQFLGDLPNNLRLNFGVNMNLASVAFKAFKGVNLVELNLRSQSALSMPKDFFSFMKTFGSSENYAFDDLGFRTQNYIELALGHSHKINDQWTVGGKMKLLFGAAYVDFDAQNFDVTMNGDIWSIKGNAVLNASSGDIVISGKDANGNINTPANPGDEFDDIEDFKPGLAGMGVAFDFGATYQPIENLTVSAAITDLGFINWKNTQSAVTSAEWEFDGFYDIYVGSDSDNKDLGEQFEDLGDELEDVFKLNYNGKSKYRKSLAATLNLAAEYKLPMYDKLKFGILYSGRMSHIYRNHQGVLTVGVRPVKCFEALVNVTGTTTGWTTGAIIALHAKHFNFHVGGQIPFTKFSKDMIPLNSLNTHFNLGMSFPL